MATAEATKTLAEIVSKFMLTALNDMFHVQASTPIDVKKIEAIKPSAIHGIDLLASTALKSSDFQGLLALCFPSSTFLGVANRMLEEKFTEITDQNADAAGELLNILYASARVRINQSGHDFMPAIPAVIRGKQIALMHGGAPLIARVHCECEFGPLYMDMSLIRSRESSEQS